MRRSSAAWSTIADFYTAFSEGLLMTALGQKRTSKQVRAMSALPPKADIVEHDRHVRFVPKADVCIAAK
jgi:hypothetical protein